MSRKFRRLLMGVAMLSLCGYLLFTNILPKINDKTEYKREIAYVQQQVEKEIYSRSDIDINKLLMQDKITNAALMVDKINTDVEHILSTIDCNFTVRHDKSPEKTWNDFAIDSKVEIKLQCKAIISIPSDKIQTTIDKSGTVCVSYDKSNIQVKAVEVVKYNAIEDRKFAGERYSNSEILALIENAQQQIKDKIRTNENHISNATKVLERHLTQMAHEFGVYTINFNDTYTQLLKGYEYIDNGNVAHGHTGKSMSQPVKYIVIHSTANKNGTPENHYNYLNTNPKAMAAHYYVGDTTIINTVDNNIEAFHSGTDEVNACSIGIEICEYTNREQQIKAIYNTADLVQALKEEFPDAEIIFHNDVTGKICPSIIYGDNPTMSKEELMNILKGVE